MIPARLMTRRMTTREKIRYVIGHFPGEQELIYFYWALSVDIKLEKCHFHICAFKTGNCQSIIYLPVVQLNLCFVCLREKHEMKRVLMILTIHPVGAIKNGLILEAVSAAVPIIWLVLGSEIKRLKNYDKGKLLLVLRVTPPDLHQII